MSQAASTGRVPDPPPAWGDYECDPPESPIYLSGVVGAAARRVASRQPGRSRPGHAADEGGVMRGSEQLSLFPACVEVSPASEWCERWRNGQPRWRHRSEGGFDPRRYTVEPIAEAVAKRYVTTHHYSHSYPAARLRWGLFDDRRLVGAAVLGVPMHELVLTRVFPELAPFDESVELSRFVLNDEVAANGESWFLAAVFAAAAARGVRGVVSFADPVPRLVGGRLLWPGHVGTIYQATNARFTGRSTPRTVIVLPDGSTLNERAMSKVRRQERGHEHVERRLMAWGASPPRAGERPDAWLRRALDDAGSTRLRHRGCYRYAFALGLTPRQRRAVRIAPAALPYPKTTDLHAA